MNRRLFLAACIAIVACLLASCSSAPKKHSHAPAPQAAAPLGSPPSNTNAAHGKDCSRYAPVQEDPGTRGDYTRGGLYKPGVRDTTPEAMPDFDCIAEPVVRDEPLAQFGNTSPYYVLGKKYKVLDSAEGYVERGTASYYGSKFHGRLTSDHEVYDVNAFTAAHKTLPLPSFARVTNLDNGRSVVVRVNDRGPFHDGRLIDLSYAAAVKLGITAKGTGNVEVRGLTPRDVAKSGKAQAALETARAQALPTPAAPAPVQATALQVTADSAQVQTEALPAAMAASTAPASTAAASSASGVQGASTSSASSPNALPPTASKLQLQVASFASRDNAERALGKLRAVGIEGVLLASEDGTHWRLRVPTDETHADALAQRIAQLGLGTPQRVRQ